MAEGQISCLSDRTDDGKSTCPFGLKHTGPLGQVKLRQLEMVDFPSVFNGTMHNLIPQVKIASVAAMMEQKPDYRDCRVERKMARTPTSLLNALKRDLAQCELGSASSYLESANITELIAFREQKILFKVTDRQCQLELAKLYKAAAARLLGESGNGRFELNYADFAVAAKQLLENASVNTSAAIGTLPDISVRHLITMFSQIATAAFEELSTNSWNEVTPRLKADQLSHAESASLSSRTFHEVVGATNDVLFASCRALNEAGARTIDEHNGNGLDHSSEEALRESLSQLITLCSIQNSIEYMVNMVTYGEWVVASITGEIQVAVQFDLVDPMFDYARTLAIRSDNMRRRVRKTKPGSTPEFTAELIRRYIVPFVERSLKYLAANGSIGTYRPNQEDTYHLYHSLLDTLGYLCADDDLLLLATHSHKLLSHYLAAVSLRWFATIWDFAAKKRSARYRNIFELATIHPDMLATLVGDEDSLTEDIRHAIPSFCRSLPMARYLDICDHPYFIGSDGQIICGTALEGGNWPRTVRSRWLQGGKSGDRYGKVWEKYVSHTFESRNWLVVGQGIKLKVGGTILTDVDLLVIRDNLLLVIQVKALIGYGTDPYEQWKSRNAISLGARQANAAVRFLRNNIKWMIGQFGDALARTISDVQPLVVTNVSIFDGWTRDDVPVVSISRLSHILSGSKFTFERSNGQVVSKEEMLGDDPITSESFMDIIRNPLDWRLAGESIQMVHVPLEFGGIQAKIPSVLGGWAIRSHTWGSGDEDNPCVVQAD